MGEISDAAGRRGITEIVHFTTNRGLTGCLNNKALMSRVRLKADEGLSSILTLNSANRKEEQPNFDKRENWIDYVNLSISEITMNLFDASLKWHAGKDIFWVILAFEPLLMDDEKVYFSTTNNIYTGTSRQEGLEGFNALFKPRVKRWHGNVVERGSRADHLTTCEQAEVLYPGQVDMAYLRRVYVNDGDEQDRVSAMLSAFDRGDVEVVLNTRKFEGQRN